MVFLDQPRVPHSSKTEVFLIKNRLISHQLTLRSYFYILHMQENHKPTVYTNLLHFKLLKVTICDLSPLHDQCCDLCSSQKAGQGAQSRGQV